MGIPAQAKSLYDILTDRLYELKFLGGQAFKDFYRTGRSPLGQYEDIGFYHVPKSTEFIQGSPGAGIYPHGYGPMNPSGDPDDELLPF